jgi:single-strand DNA-binding protein
VDTMITVVGNVVDSPRKSRVNSGSVTNFRMASTGRRFDPGTQQYVDSTTFYIDVECWNDLSSHVAGSVSQGDPVIVVGAISTQEWETDNGRRSKPRIRARAVGHDLARGMSSSFTRIKSSRPTAALAGDPSAEPVATGLPGDPSDEQYAGLVDPLTGELVEAAAGDASEDIDAILRGRDYVADPGTLHSLTADDLAAEPAQA